MSDYFPSTKADQALIDKVHYAIRDYSQHRDFASLSVDSDRAKHYRFRDNSVLIQHPTGPITLQTPTETVLKDLKERNTK